MKLWGRRWEELKAIMYAGFILQHYYLINNVNLLYEHFYDFVL